MKKTGFHFFRLFFALVIVFIISFLFCQTNFVYSIYSTLFANSQSVVFEVEEGSCIVARDGITQLYITDVEVANKEYDGTTEIQIVNIVAEDGNGDEVTGVTIEAQANTFDANAGTNKYVTISNFQVVGANAANYEIVGENYGAVLVDILPYKNNSATPTLFWETKDISGSTPVSIAANEYVYSGKDQRNGVMAYYENISGQRVYLFVNIVRTDASSNNHKNEFINAGSYEAQVVLTAEEQNYYLRDSFGGTKLSTLKMNKAQPQLTYNNGVTFTYTGALQSLRSFVSLNNTEQTLVFENDTFRNLNDGKNRIVTVSAVESQNYKRLAETTFQVPAINFIRRTSPIDVSNIPTEYTYTGGSQTIPHLATINDNLNIEQTLKYSSEQTFLNCEKNRAIVIFADATEETGNFASISKTIYININKATIDTSNWRWSRTVFDYDPSAEAYVYVNGFDSSLVSVTYSNNRAVNAGVYTASATFTLKDTTNYEPVSFVGNTIVWRINKTQVTKPNLQDRETPYTGAEQYFDVANTIYYGVTNNTKTNAGNYVVCVSLNDVNNYEWKDGSTSPLMINWKINKAKIKTPVYSKVFYYSGESISVQVPANALYAFVNNSQTEVGKYKSYLFLTDTENYEWEDNPNSTFLVLDWEIKAQTTSAASPVLAIIILSLIIIISATYITLHFTIRARRRRRKKVAVAATPAQVDVSEENVTIPDKKEVKATTNKQATSTKVEAKEVKPTPKVKVESKEPVKEKSTAKAKTSSQEAKAKTRKKRMLSMKKNDKKERRKKEHVKLAKLKRPPAKRGRPPKKVSKRRTTRKK